MVKVIGEDVGPSCIVVEASEKCEYYTLPKLEFFTSISESERLELGSVKG